MTTSPMTVSPTTVSPKAVAPVSTWTDRAATDTMIALPKRPLMPALLRGFACKCPSCGRGALFDGYLTVRDTCEVCGEELHHHRADDAPPYFTILIVGHIIVSLVLAVEIAYAPPLWLHVALWVPLTILSALAVLRPIKGAVVGLQWALYMHGFDPNSEPEMPDALPAALKP